MPSHADQLLGLKLSGTKRPGQWTVTSKIGVKPTTGGNFSVCYHVQHETGESAFLKATDVGLLTRFDAHSSPLERLFRATTEHRFEREILDVCLGNNMDRVVKALDYGEITLTFNNQNDIVFFIIFEAAVGDVRSTAVADAFESPKYVLRALHHVAVGIHQLHRKEIAHNDLKPSNVLVFQDSIQKVSDLGRATSNSIAGPWDPTHCVGDRGYVPPEQWGYKVDVDKMLHKIVFSFRAPSDLYMIGSLAYFFLSGASMTPVMMHYIRPEHRPENWTETFKDVLPYLQDAHANAMEALPDAIKQGWPDRYHSLLLELLPIVRELTNPDFTLRGDPQNRRRGMPIHNLQRIISRIDTLANKAQTK